MKILNAILAITASVTISACGSARKASEKDSWQRADNQPYCKMPVPEDYPQTHNLIIFYDADTGSKPLINAAEKYGSQIIYKYENFNAIAVTVPEGKSQDNAVEYYKAVSGATSVQIDRTVQLH